MEYKIDYLTLTIKPKTIDISVLKMERFLFDFLGLTKFQNTMLKLNTVKFYDYMYRYNDINIKVPAAFNADVQGFCIEFSGQGLAWYKDYKTKYDKEFDYKQFITAFFSFADLGYDCRCTRIDIAFDDIDYTDRNVYKLDLKRIESALLNGEFVSLFHCKPKKKENMSIECGIDEQLVTKKSKGKTLYLGNRKSSTFCRFYDKLAEQKQKKNEVDEKIKHWARMEFEFKDKRAMSVCDAIIVLSSSDLSKYLARVVNKYVCFKVFKGVTRSHLYRAPQKRWWTNLIGTIEKTSLTNNYEHKNRYFQVKKWLGKSVFPSLFQLALCESLDNIFYDVMCAGFERCTAKHEEIYQDFINQPNYEQLQGYEVHKLTCNEFEELVKAFERIKELTAIVKLRKQAQEVFTENKYDYIEKKIKPNTRLYGKHIDEFQGANIYRNAPSLVDEYDWLNI